MSLKNLATYLYKQGKNVYVNFISRNILPKDLFKQIKYLYTYSQV